ncbi:hypothetical protein BH10PSE2_BH10PSE2_09140 [soil metagenome]
MRTILLGACALTLSLAACDDAAEKAAPAAPATAASANGAAPMAPAAATQTAEAYTRGLYANVGGADFSSQTDTAGPQIYSASTWGKIQAANAKAGEGEMGPIEAEPLCQCQDNTGMTLASLTTTSTGATTADAVVGLKSPDGGITGLTLKLIKDGTSWKVDDVQPDGDPGLLLLLAG